MRQRKFKVWDNVDYMSEPFTLHDLMTGKIQFTESCIVRDWTGLKDKNDKEIYEGDILSDGIECSPVYWNEQYGSFETSEVNGNIFKYMNIIGNIHEHPELLNELTNKTT